MREPEGELDLTDYLAFFRRRWRWVAGTVLIVTGLVTLFTFTREERFRSISEIQILTRENQTTFNVDQPGLFRDAVAELQYMAGSDYAEAVNELAGFQVGIRPMPRFADPSERIGEVGVLRIEVRATSPSRARQGAAAAVEVYLRNRVEQLNRAYAQRLENDTEVRAALQNELIPLRRQINAAQRAADAETDDDRKIELQIEADRIQTLHDPRIQNITSQVGGLNGDIENATDILAILEEPDSTARLFKRATLPNKPIEPDVPRNIMIGIVIGLILGLILAVLRDLLDTRAHDAAALARLVDVPVMATIGEIRSPDSVPARSRRYRDLSVEEASGYQILLNSLWLTNVDDPLQSIVFTSDRPQVGKTQTVVNLAQAEAARGTRVLVIDTDFVNPSVAERLDLEPGELGLSNLLEGTAPPEVVIRTTEVPNLHIIDAQGATGAGELFRSDRLAGVLGDLYGSYDLILIDSPPTLSTADSRLVASQVDAVVVVYDPSESRLEELQHTIDLLRSARANLVGLVANRSREPHPVYLVARER